MERMPKKFEAMIEQYCELGRAIDKALRTFTNDAVGMCSPDHVQFWTDEYNLNDTGGCRTEEFKQLVGHENVKFKYASECGYLHYDVIVGTEVCTLVTTNDGGAYNDVSVN